MHITKRILAENYRYVDDVLRSLTELSKHVDELMSLQRLYQKQITSALILEISTKTKDKLSPESEMDKAPVTVPGIQKIRNNYKVVKDLWEVKSNLDSMEIKIRQSFAGRDEDVSRATAELNKLKVRINSSLREAFAFLQEMGGKHLPSGFKDFNGYLDKIISKSIAYEDSKAYTYVYEVDGDPVFSTYAHLQKVVDDANNYFPDLFIISSYKLGRDPSYYVAVSTEFSPPSSDNLMKKVGTVKEAVRALNMLLSMDNFSTSMGSLPISQLVNERNLQRELFLYQQYIKQIELGEHTIKIVLKPEVTNKEDVDRILIQMIKDFQPLVRTTRGKLNTSIKKGPNSYYLTFYLVMGSDGPLATADDFEFLRSRLNLSDATIDKVVRTINSSS